MNTNPWEILKEAVGYYPPLKYAIGVVGVFAAVACIIFLVNGDSRTAVVGFILMLLAMGIMVVFGRSLRPEKRARRNARFSPEIFLIWLVVTAFGVTLMGIFSSVAFCTPFYLAEYIRGRPCGVDKIFTITHPLNGEGVYAEEGDTGGDFVTISGQVLRPGMLEGKKIYLALQSLASRNANPPIVYFQGYASLTDKVWRATQNSLGSAESRIPRGDGRCVKLYRVIAIALTDNEFAQFKLPAETPGESLEQLFSKWNEVAVPWENVSRLVSPDKSNFDEAVVGTYVLDRGSKCRYLEQNS